MADRRVDTGASIYGYSGAIGGGVNGGARMGGSSSRNLDTSPNLLRAFNNTSNAG